jgi:hypothetical protein
MYYNISTLTMVQVFLTKMTPKTHHASLEWFFNVFLPMVSNGGRRSSSWTYPAHGRSVSLQVLNHIETMCFDSWYPKSCSYPKMIQKGNCCGTCVTCVPRGPTRFAHQIAQGFLNLGLYLAPMKRIIYNQMYIYII